ncbi:MAG TPA: hypothetical protein VF447_00665, partial [Terriglobales bacterium]
SFAAARTSLERAAQSNSNQKDIAEALRLRLNMARADLYQGKTVAAAKNLKEIAASAEKVGLLSVSLLANFYYGQALAESRSYAQARSILETVLRKVQDSGMKSLLPQTHYWLAIALRGSGQRAEADGHLQLARKALQDMRAESHSDDITKRVDLKPIPSESGQS